MIFDLLIDGLFAALGGLIDLLPDDTLTWPDFSSWGATVGDMAGPLDSLLPVAELAATAGLTITVVWPALFVYRLTLWIWGKIPILGGGS